MNMESVIDKKEELKALSEEVLKTAEEVKICFGPKGQKVKADITNGSVANSTGMGKEIELDNSREYFGSNLLRKLISQMDEKTGDGTTVAAILAQNLICSGLKNIIEGVDVQAMVQGMNEAAEEVLLELDNMSKEVSDSTEIEQIATVAANGDKAVGNLITDALRKVGRNGIFTVRDSNSIETILDIREGIKFDNGYVNPNFIDNPKQRQVDFEDALVLVADQTIRSLRSFLPLLNYSENNNQPLLMISRDINEETLANLVTLRQENNFGITAVKVPRVDRKNLMGKLADFTGCTVISRKKGNVADNVSTGVLGTADRVKITKKSTTLIGGAGNTDELQKKIERIRFESAFTLDRDKVRSKTSSLGCRVACVHIGAATETEAAERVIRTENAISSTKAALDKGVVPGGGTAFVRASEKLNQKTEKSGSYNKGVKLVKNALLAPMKTIADNAGYEGEVVVERVQRESSSFGFNAQTGIYEVMIEAGIVDPAGVLQVAVESAISTAETLFINQINKKHEPAKNTS